MVLVVNDKGSFMKHVTASLYFNWSKASSYWLQTVTCTWQDKRPPNSLIVWYPQTGVNQMFMIKTRVTEYIRNAKFDIRYSNNRIFEYSVGRILFDDSIFDDSIFDDRISNHFEYRISGDSVTLIKILLKRKKAH